MLTPPETFLSKDLLFEVGLLDDPLLTFEYAILFYFLSFFYETKILSFILIRFTLKTSKSTEVMNNLSSKLIICN